MHKSWFPTGFANRAGKPVGGGGGGVGFSQVKVVLMYGASLASAFNFADAFPQISLMCLLIFYLNQKLCVVIFHLQSDMCKSSQGCSHVWCKSCKCV